VLAVTEHEVVSSVGLWRGVSNTEVVPIEAWYIGDAFEARAHVGALHSFNRTEAGVARRIVEADAPDKTVFWTAVSFKCFPSAIDPRGPTAKNDPDAHLWHPWLRINRVLRVMLLSRNCRGGQIT
jgi:hypothetical protein